MIFASDLDNTLIFSYKHRQNGDIPVELREGKELSFMTAKAHCLLKKTAGKAVFIPVTTRSFEQYNRINFGFIPEFAIIENGARILVRGSTCGFLSSKWEQETAELLNTEHGDSIKFIQSVRNNIQENMDIYCVSEVRTVNSYFIFGKFTDSIKCARSLTVAVESIKAGLFDVFIVGNKFYVCPKKLTKGTAVERLRTLFPDEKIFASGDSDMDIPMLEKADRSFKADHGRNAEVVLEAALKFSSYL